MQEARVTSSGAQSTHPLGDVIDRPSGAGEYVFLHFLGPVLLEMGGRSYRAGFGHCLILGPRTGHRYHGDGVGLANDWFHFTGPGAARLVAHRGLPLDSLFRPPNTSYLSSMIEEMQLELIQRETGWEEALGLLLNQALLRVQRSLARRHEAATPHMARVRERLRGLRLEVMRSLEAPWNVDRMAARVALSRTRFTTVYTECFGVSPMEDLIRARLQRAAWLLGNTRLSVGEVAQRSGFTNPYYFSRAFRQRTGCAPRDYGGRRRAADDARDP